MSAGRPGHMARRGSLRRFAVVGGGLEVLRQEVDQNVRFGIRALDIIGLSGQRASRIATHFAEALQIGAPQALQLFTGIGTGLGHRESCLSGRSNKASRMGVLTGKLRRTGQIGWQGCRCCC